MKQSRPSRQGELFATNEVIWQMFSKEQQQQTVELLSLLLIESLNTEPKKRIPNVTPEQNNE